MFPVIFPIYIAALAPLHRSASLIWLGGVVCLWLTRYTHQLGRRWGAAYYGLSVVVRPLGVALIGAGWLALYAPMPAVSPFMGMHVGWLPRGSWTDVLWLLGIVASFALGLWAVGTLGLRRSFLFRRQEDPLIMRGPYAWVRHPQFLSAIGIAIFGALLFNPSGVTFDGGWYEMLPANCVLLTLALWLLALLEDRELAAHFGEEYRAYAARVGRLWPRPGRTMAALTGWCEPPAQLRAMIAWVQEHGRPYAGTLQALEGAIGAMLVALAVPALGLAVYNVDLMGGPAVWSISPDRADALCWLVTLAFLAFGLWAVAALGLRRSILGPRAGEAPCRRGPYALLRHPQYLSAMAVTLLVSRPFDPMPLRLFFAGDYYHLGACWPAYALALWALALAEDHLLAARHGAAQEEYARTVPGLLPN